MRKLLTIIGISILLITIGIAGFIILDSKGYFDNYFKISNGKILLSDCIETELTIDSLNNEIVLLSDKNDSLVIVFIEYGEIIDVKMQQIKELNVNRERLVKSNINLNSVISHQNNMINQLKTQLDNCK